MTSVDVASVRRWKPYEGLRPSRAEWLGRIPTHWDTKRIKHLIRAPLAYGVLKPDKYLGDDGVPIIRILDVSEGEVATHQLHRISPELSVEYSRTILAEGDLVVSVVGTLGRAFIVPSELHSANVSRALARIQLADCQFALGPRPPRGGCRPTPDQ